MPTLGVFGQGSAARLYLPVRCVAASSLTLGYGAGIAQAAGSFDGNTAILTASGTADTLTGWIGIASADIASNAYGLVQCWGAAASVYLSQVSSSITINAQNALVPGAEAGGLFSVVPTYLNAGFKFVICTNPPATVSMAKTANYSSGLVRCL